MRMMPVSIHAPARGATITIDAYGTSATRFNSRSREGSDQKSAEEIGNEQVSIHAPARGATVLSLRPST